MWLAAAPLAWLRCRAYCAALRGFYKRSDILSRNQLATGQPMAGAHRDGAQRASHFAQSTKPRRSAPFVHRPPDDRIPSLQHHPRTCDGSGMAGQNGHERGNPRFTADSGNRELQNLQQSLARQGAVFRHSPLPDVSPRAAASRPVVAGYRLPPCGKAAPRCAPYGIQLCAQVFLKSAPATPAH